METDEVKQAGVKEPKRMVYITASPDAWITAGVLQGDIPKEGVDLVDGQLVVKPEKDPKNKYIVYGRGGKVIKRNLEEVLDEGFKAIEEVARYRRALTHLSKMGDETARIWAKAVLDSRIMYAQEETTDNGN